MARYIDAGKAIEAIMDLPNCPNGYSDTYDKACIIGMLEEVPPADVVEVVRCKDCKFYNEDEMMCNDTNGFDRYWKPTDFCSYGKRREDE